MTIKPKDWRPSKKYLQGYKALYGVGKDTLPQRSFNVEAVVKPKSHSRSKAQAESAIQIQLVTWADSLGLPLFSIPNHGKRSRWEGAKQVAMGLRAGVSDLFLPVMRGSYGGFWIELKSPGKKPTATQRNWLALMQQNGYHAAWFDSYAPAKQAIEEYLKLSENE